MYENRRFFLFLHPDCRKELMKTKIILLAFFLLAGVALKAQGYGNDRYSISAYADYGYNSSWKNYGGFDVRGFLPLARHFEMTANAEILTSGVFSSSVTARPKFLLPVGEIFIDGTVSFRNLYKYESSELVLAASAGYRMNYISVQAGLSCRGMFDAWDSPEKSSVWETPLNLVYRVAFRVRPLECRWNVGGGISNYDEYEYERMWQPMFFINGHYDLSDRFTLLACVRIKPTGTFQQIASFYGIDTRIGISFKF